MVQTKEKHRKSTSLKVKSKIHSFLFKDSVFLFPKPARKDIHKGDRGYLWVCGGSPGFWGAGIMASRASIRSGSGYTTMMSESKDVLQISMYYPELLTHHLNSPDQIFNQLKSPTAIVVGPGFGRTSFLKKWILYLKKHAAKIPIIIDADGIFILAAMSEKLKKMDLPQRWILTPHEGEMARLIQRSIDYVHQNRIEALRLAQQKFKCSILLKGHHSLFINETGEIFLIRAGNPVLAKAGTGDVLAGLMGGLLAQGYASSDAALLSAFWHADFGDWYVKNKGCEFSLIASEMIDLFPQYWSERYGKKVDSQNI